MKTKIFVSLLGMFFLAACKKDKYTTKPQLTFKNVNTTRLDHNQTITFTFQVTDKEGDIQDSLWVQKVEPKCGGSNFTAKYKMPNFTATKSFNGEVSVCFAYGNNLGCPTLSGPSCARNDTATFRFWIKDKAGNRSDTASSPLIAILR